jgi:hypothetical protein
VECPECELRLNGVLRSSPEGLFAYKALLAHLDRGIAKSRELANIVHFGDVFHFSLPHTGIACIHGAGRNLSLSAPLGRGGWH